MFAGGKRKATATMVTESNKLTVQDTIMDVIQTGNTSEKEDSMALLFYLV